MQRKCGNPIDDGSTYFHVESSADPNYDSEEETGFEFIPEVSNFQASRSISLHPLGTRLTLSQFKSAIEPIIEEYFVSTDLSEFFRCISELDEPGYAHEVVKRSVNMSLDRRDNERELVSKMISASYPDIFSTSIISRGFERLLEISHEIEKDVPSSTEMLAAFIARSVLDEVLAPSFLNDPIICDLGGKVVDLTKRMLSREHIGARIERVWGPGDGRPVDDLKIAVDQLLLEYVTSRELIEASRCIKDLNAPHFHHEIVKRAIVIALDKSEENQVAISELFIHLSERDLISLPQFETGFLKTYSIMNDLILDTPNALTIVSKFVDEAIENNILTPDFWCNIDDQ